MKTLKFFLFLATILCSKGMFCMENPEQPKETKPLPERLKAHLESLPKEEQDKFIIDLLVKSLCPRPKPDAEKEQIPAQSGLPE